MDYEKTGRLIAERRHSLGLTQLQLAEKIGVSNRAVSKWECGSGFPDVSLLEPLADALDLSVIELMHGEQEEINRENDLQVREAVRIVGQEAKRQLRRAMRIARLCFVILLACFLAFHIYEFLVTDGDGFNPVENVRVIGQGYESNCKSLPTRGVYRIEILTPNSHRAITDPDAIHHLLEVLAEIEVGKEYRDWGPHSLEASLLIHASGWTPSDQFIDTEDYAFEFTFPAFSAERVQDVRAENNFYYQAEIDGEDAWKTIQAVLETLPTVPVS